MLSVSNVLPVKGIRVIAIRVTAIPLNSKTWFVLVRGV
jgi:hypothetical protein